ncbi:hypothetical protein Taro_050126 [Colocasia esculenta]|uniref:Uncharacterized protein n=1 Tax=Colocasia esculenta TaxID=4460 RepID=A0A843XCL5_COLES|nr:hypothetical protein [Colocasia esculenta]
MTLSKPDQSPQENIPMHSDISIFPPEKSKTKGSGKCIKSAKEIAIEQSTKGRLCNGCKRRGVDHDKRSVDTRDNSQKLSGSIWDSVSTLDQVVLTLETFSEHLLGYFGTVCQH